jgi:hypothetical protein
MPRFPLPKSLLLASLMLTPGFSLCATLAGAQEEIPVPVIEGADLPAAPLADDFSMAAPVADPFPGATLPACPPGSSLAYELPPASPFAGSLFERPKLTGNWLGLRDGLALNGIALDVSSTNFYQGVASGGINETFEYAGRGDYYLNVDGQKAGLWAGSRYDQQRDRRDHASQRGNALPQADRDRHRADRGEIHPGDVGELRGLRREAQPVR